MAATDRSRSDAAKQRRQDQLQRWSGSETDRTGPDTRETSVGGPGARRARVRFAQGAVFMAACSAGDQEEVAALLRQGADINHANIDGLTALHQACIDENSEMVQFLVESGSDINRGDNEGWTPLHAAASCGFIQITKYLIEQGAQVGAVNSEGELPLDVATEDAMERLLKGEIKKQGVDMDQARKQEQRVMLQDATAVLTGSGSLVPHHNTKATALHVAAAKGYIEVLKVLLQCELDVDSMDVDGWTALHAAAHWGQEEVCSLLADHMCDMAAVNNVGQTPLDVSDENLVGTLEELQKKQNALRSEREKQNPVIDMISPITVPPVRLRRTSISRMSSKEKICLHEREKHPPPALRSTPAEEEEEEPPPPPPPAAPGPGQAKASSSSSSEEESESESDAESEKAKNREIINNLNNKHNSGGLLATSTSTSGIPAKKQEPSKSQSQSTEAPGSWRTSLRKAGSSVTLGSAGGSDPSQDPPRPLDSGLGMTRSASSPRLSSEAEPKEPRLARVTPTPSRRLFSIPDANADNSSSWLSRSSSYSRRHHSQLGSDLTGSDLTSSNPALPRSSSYGRRLDDFTTTSASLGSASVGLGRLNNPRNSQEATEKKEQEPVPTPASSTSTSTTTTSSSSSTTNAGDTDGKQRRKSYLTPVRDEEAEAQRKARSRHARQSRRSTQGVTLTDLQEAEKTIKTDNKEREKKKEEEEKEKEREKEREKEKEREREKEKEKEKEAKLKKAGEEGELSWRSRNASLQKSDLLGLTQPAGTTPRPPLSDRKEVKAMAGESETDRWARESRERRRARARRRAQRAGESDDNEPSGEEEFSGSGLDPQTGRPLIPVIPRSNLSCNDCSQGAASEAKDYKKLFDEVSRENSHLQSQLQDTQRIVSQTRVDLEKATQRQERISDCSTLLDLEKKVLGDLKADNQRLKDENGALIRVISKLSK
ncbi:protein phosphatase 1 regulatory subunit 12A isoform X4 [Gadus macrocephalus]|uniref:protein phosphatase 1 regulatory subunit 12A isoform X4 n=1 Tax=Gadus macrocephalus TaxID=80720 RepID=UPI0028CB670F|nr:protein phosphatase 1 regulatory subunit 12A isoform X4 [Gadus macrocephalus]